jgi:exodeoxyribonuclease VII large subunit
MDMEIRAMTVSEVNGYIKKCLGIDPILSNITVKGEISNCKLHNSGHLYFSLKDNESRLRCVMFRSYSDGLAFIPGEGKKVIAKGNISVYERDGQYQLYVKEMVEDGMGELYAAFEHLKKKLETMGYFDEARKKKLPFIPRKIGVVTSAQGAAIRDIISVTNRRFNKVDIVVYNALVQGERAPEQLCRGIEYFNHREPVDVIIVGRGGGSIEELWAFNDENLARAIYNSSIPVVSAVGHQTDFTIADFVADLRAPTPTAAAELVVPEIKEVMRQLRDYYDRMKLAMLKQLKFNRKKLELLKGSYGLRQPLDRIGQSKQQLDDNMSRASRAIYRIIERKKQLLEQRAAELNSLSPLEVLARGYSVVKNPDTGKAVKSVDEVEKGRSLSIIMRDGEINARVLKIRRGSACLDGK